MKRVFFSVILLCLFLLPGIGESLALPADREVPPPPVVSGLQAVCKDTTVTLTWVKAPGIAGDNIILRSNRPITAANYKTADTRGTVPVAKTRFEDSIEPGQDYYYAVLSRDSDGTAYDFFLPVSNALVVPVSAGPVQTPAKETVLSTFDVITRNDAVIITWKSSLAGKNIVLYRSTSPFTDMTSLVQAILVSTLVDTGAPFVDYPVPGVPYFYAVIDEDTLRTGSVQFAEGQNTNRIPVEIPASYARIKRSTLPSIRPIPLPYLNLSQNAETPKWHFSDKTEKIIQKVTAHPIVKKESAKNPFVFLSDKDSVSGGEEYNLKKILDTSFSSHTWNTAISDLNDFLAIRRTAETTARTHFYLGEAWFFSGNYRKALPEFLLSQDLYYNQANEWIQYTLDRMVSPGDS
jgi:hypothetical protein